MKTNSFFSASKSILLIMILMVSGAMVAQGQTAPKPQNDFMKNVQFGGGIGLNFGSGYTNISLAPSAIYNVNPILSVGVAVQFGYISEKNYYDGMHYGGSLIGLVNPIPQIQLSAELEQLRFNLNYVGGFSDNYWNTALYLGAGYRAGNTIIGARYDVLNANNDYYAMGGFMPFVRVYF